MAHTNTSSPLGDRTLLHRDKKDVFKYPHGTTDRLRVYGVWTIVRYCHHIPFWNAIHAGGHLLGGDEGGSRYQVGRDLYVLAHDGNDYYQFIVPFYFSIPLTEAPTPRFPVYPQ